MSRAGTVGQGAGRTFHAWPREREAGIDQEQDQHQEQEQEQDQDQDQEQYWTMTLGGNMANLAPDGLGAELASGRDSRFRRVIRPCGGWPRTHDAFCAHHDDREMRHWAIRANAGWSAPWSHRGARALETGHVQ
jgi:hypothetical protein